MKIGFENNETIEGWSKVLDDFKAEAEEIIDSREEVESIYIHINRGRASSFHLSRTKEYQKRIDNRTDAEKNEQQNRLWNLYSKYTDIFENTCSICGKSATLRAISYEKVIMPDIGIRIEPNYVSLCIPHFLEQFENTALFEPKSEIEVEIE